MKATHIIYWTTTMLIFIWDGVIPALTFNSPLAIEGIRHLGYPDYFRIMLTVFKVIGAVVLILPQLKSIHKEWAYVGFAITYISATVSSIVVDNFNGLTILPILTFCVLTISYITYHKLLKKKYEIQD